MENTSWRQKRRCSFALYCDQRRFELSLKVLQVHKSEGVQAGLDHIEEEVKKSYRAEETDRSRVQQEMISSDCGDLFHFQTAT